MAKNKQKYSAEIHFGLLLIIFILLLVNVLTNYTLYNARLEKRDHIAFELSASAMTISRNISQIPSNTITSEQLQLVKKKYNLDDFFILPEITSKKKQADPNVWFESAMHTLPVDKLPQVANVLLNTEPYTLKRGQDHRYFYSYPFTMFNKKYLLILAKDDKEMAYLEDTARNIFYISVSALILLVMVYFRLYKYILAPFQRIRKEAHKAGMDIIGDTGDVEAIIEHYQSIVKELQEKEQKLLEYNQAIRRKADNLETYNQYLLDSMLTGVISLDPEGNIRALNKAAETITRKLEHVITGKHISTIEGLSEQLVEKIQHCLQSELYLEYTEFTNNIDNHELTWGVSIAPIYNEQQDRLGISLLIHDLTELTKLRQDAERNNQLAALGEMAAGLAHQLRNSIGAITGYNRLLGKKLEKNNQDTTTVGDISQELSEAEQMIAKFLSFTRPFEFNPEQVHIAVWLNTIIRQSHISTLYPDIQLNIHHDSDLPDYCQFDTILLKQAILNIIENSAQAYNNKAGEINIRVTKQELEIIIAIADTAGGIPDEIIENIFTPFYSTNPSGTGLGLPLAKKIVALHQGRLTVTSGAGRGTTFEITLPQQSIPIPSG